MTYGSFTITALFLAIHSAAAFQATHKPPTEAAIKASSDLTRLMEEGKAAAAKNENGTAEDHFKQALAIARKYNLGPGVEAVPLVQLTLLANRRHDNAAEFDYAKSYLDAVRKRPGPGKSTDVAGALGQLAGVAFLLNRQEEGQEYLKQALAELDDCAAKKTTGDYGICRRVYWDTYGTIAGVLYLHNQTDRANEMIQQVLKAPEREVRPLVWLVMLRAEADLAVKKRDAKESFLAIQRLVYYEKEHPDVVAQLGPPDPDAQLQREAALETRAIVQDGLAGTLPPSRDYSRFGQYGEPMQMLHEFMFQCQQINFGARNAIGELDLKGALKPEILVDPQSLQRSRDKVSAAILEIERLMVKSQGAFSDLQARMKKRATETSGDQRKLFDDVFFGLSGGSAVFRDRLSDMDAGFRKGLVRLDELLAFLQKKSGQYHLVENHLVFDDPDDLAVFQAGVASVTELQERAMQIMKGISQDLERFGIAVPKSR